MKKSDVFLLSLFAVLFIIGIVYYQRSSTSLNNHGVYVIGKKIDMYLVEVNCLLSGIMNIIIMGIGMYGPFSQWVQRLCILIVLFF